MGFRIHRGIFQKLNDARTAYENTFKIDTDGRIKEVDSDGNVTAGYLKVGEQATDADTVDGLHSGSFLRSDTSDTFTGGNFTIDSAGQYRVLHAKATRRAGLGTGSAGSNTPPFLFENAGGDQAWGVVAEFRLNEDGRGGDSPAILFSDAQQSTQWTVGFDYTGSEFGIRKNRGIYSNGWGTSYFKINTSGKVFIPGEMEVDSRIYADNGVHVRGDWLRVNGTNGVYFESYGGGWHMQDSTWLRAYGNKGIRTGGNIEVDGTIRSNGNGFYVDSTNVINSSGQYVADVVNSTTNSRYFIQNAHGNPRNNLGSPTVTEMALFESQFRCMTDLSNSYTNLDRLTFWVQQNEGDAWAEVTVSDDQKKRFLRTNNSNVAIPNRAYKYRVEFKAPGYVFANALYFYWSSNSHSTKVHVYKYNASQDTWHAHATSNTNVSSWPGHLYLPFSTIPWHETTTTSTGHHRYIRVEFIPNWSNHETHGGNAISLNGGQIWGGYPSGRRTPHRIDHNGNYFFPASLYADNSTSSDDILTTRRWVGEQEYATRGFVTTSLDDLVDSAPGALNTLNELAAALGDDANFSTTVTNAIAAKANASHSHGIGGIDDAPRWWNNFGDNHTTRTSFDAENNALTTGFGWRYVQGSANGPGTSTSPNQYYALTVGLGNDYNYDNYGMQLVIPRNTATPYISVRFEESRSLGAWQKISAGYADTAGSANAVTWANVSSKPSTFAPSSHDHDDRYYTETEIDTKLSGKANSSHDHSSISTITVTSENDAVPGHSTFSAYLAQGSESTTTAGGDGAILSTKWSGGDYVAQLYYDVDPTNVMAFRGRNSSGWGRWNTVWHDGNLLNVSQLSNDAGYLTSVPSEYLTQTEGDARYLQSLPSHSHTILTALGDYVWRADTNPRDFPAGIQTSFVNATNGYPNYGSVMRIKTYNNDGGAGELYFPYSSGYGGDTIKYRLGQYNNAGFTDWYNIASREWVASQSYLTSVPSEYLTQTEGDARYLGVSAKAADSNLIDGVDSTAIVYGGAGRASSRVSSMDDRNQKSGFYYDDNAIGEPTRDWYNWMTVAGNSWQNSNNYSFQLAHAFHSDSFHVRRMTNGVTGGWREIVTIVNGDGRYLGISAKAADANLLDGINSTSFLRSDANDTFTGTLTMGKQHALVANNYGRGVYGTYDSRRYQHVWSMGTAYNLADDGTTAGNLYGLAWTHTNVGGESKSGLSHQLLLMMNGRTYTALGNGIWTSGTITTSNHGTSANWNTAYGWGNHASAGYLTSVPNLAASKITSGTFASARIPNLAASKITSGTFANARISQSSVTQHQSALSIAASQVSGLSPAIPVTIREGGEAQTVTITGIDFDIDRRRVGYTLSNSRVVYVPMQ